MSDDIFTAAEQNNTKRLEQFLADGADPNQQDGERENTPLHWAAAKGNLDAIEILLEYGADVNAQNKHGRTGLHSLISERYDKLALWLVEYCNADPYIADKRGVTPFDLCQKFFQPEMEAAIKNRGKAMVEPDKDDSTEESSDEDIGPAESIKIFTANTTKFKELPVFPATSVEACVLQLVESLGWPKPYTRYIELVEHITKVVGGKRMKKERVCGVSEKVLQIKSAWPLIADKNGAMTNAYSYFFFRVSPSAKNVPTQLHVLYGQV